MVSLGGVAGAFPTPFTHGLCSVKHNERVARHGGGKRRRKVCAAPAGSRGEHGVPVEWEAWGNGMGGAGMSPGKVWSNCEMEGPQEVMGWEGKAGKAAARCIATLGLTYQVHCFQMGKPNHWTWLCLEGHV